MGVNIYLLVVLAISLLIITFLLSKLGQVHGQLSLIKGNQMILSISAKENYAIITVKDNGIGILPVDLPHIFERMYQADHSRSAIGNGLGLSIVKELVSAHKGKITVTSTPSFGTEFTITLPKAL